jgi:general secretion pathway protein G
VTGAARRFEAGFSLVGALAGITIMLILMAVAMPAWRYVMQDDREEELIFRGTQIVDAIARFQRETRSLPVSLEVMVQKKFLRKAYTDPMSKSGRWRFIHPGEAVPPPLPSGGGAAGRGNKFGAEPEAGGGGLGRPGPGSRAGAQPESDPRKPGALGVGMGPIMGVASTNKAKSLRLFNGRSHYNEWIFTMGMPRIVGKMPLVIPVPGSGPGAGPAPKPIGGAPKR